MKQTDRFFVYLWEDTDSTAAGHPEIKFGDHWVPGDIKDAVEDTEKYIRRSQGRQKHKFDQGRVIVHRMWDVSDFARKVGRFKPHGKVDDAIRGCIGHHLHGDIHSIDADKAVIKVNEFLIKSNQPLPDVSLSPLQNRAVLNILNAIHMGRKTIGAELHPRLGKNIVDGVVFREAKPRFGVMVINSWEPNSFVSAHGDLTSFEQFKDFEHVDMKENNYQDRINKFRAQGKQVVAYLSNRPGKLRTERLNFLRKLKCRILWVTDEGDNGSHRETQAELLKSARRKDDVVIIQTGTNIDRAVRRWPWDHLVQINLWDALLEKKIQQRRGRKPQSSIKKLKHFDVDVKRSLLFPFVEFYQADLASIVKEAKRLFPNEEFFNDDELPSWAKFNKAPVKAKGFWQCYLRAKFAGGHGINTLNVDYQAGKRSPGVHVHMMFLGKITNDSMGEAVTLAQEALPNFLIVPVYGGVCSGRTSVPYVKDEIDKAEEKGQSVLILASMMGQRSFTVKEITDLHLAFDRGETGATIQRLSRALTGDTIDKVARIWSDSFDPNRDDKFGEILLALAQRHKKNHNFGSMKASLADILKTLDIFNATEDGRIRYDIDEYLKILIAQGSVARTIGRAVDMSKLSDHDIQLLAKVNPSNGTVASISPHGRTQQKGNSFAQQNSHTKGLWDKTVVKALKTISFILEHFDILRDGVGAQNIHEIFSKLDSNKNLQDDVETELGVPYVIIKKLFVKGLNKDHLELLWDV